MKVHSIGGFSEVGRNMACVEIGEDAFIFDCGLYLTPIVEVDDNSLTKSNLVIFDNLINISQSFQPGKEGSNHPIISPIFLRTIKTVGANKG